MLVEKMRCYFLYNVPVTERIMVPGQKPTIGVTRELVRKLGQQFKVEPVAPPAFYTNHYREEHTPFLIHDEFLNEETYVDQDELSRFGFYSMVGITQPIKLTWEFVLSIHTTGLITICLEIAEPLDSQRAYRLSGLHLNPDYRVIATEPIAQLWSNLPDKRPTFVTLDELAYAIHQHFFIAAGLSVRRLKALRHEIQIPFTTVEVTTDCQTQTEFVEKHRSDLANLVFKPACWEVENPSPLHAEHILDESRVWSVAQDTYVVTAYEGAVYVKIKTFDTGISNPNSGFYLADESAVLYSFKVAVTNYHLLRIIDDRLDREIEQLKREMEHYQAMLRDAIDNPAITDNKSILREMNDFVIQVTNLQFELIEIMEELDNSDKLIDEEWHIVLLDKLNAALGLKVWRDGLQQRVLNLHELVQTVEHTFQRLVDLNLNKGLLELSQENVKAEARDKRVGYLFGVFAVAELLGLLIDVGLDDANPLILWMSRSFGMTLFASHIVGAIGVFVLIVFLLWSISVFVNRA